MFNNFNNLLALIEEEPRLAGKFLNNLSKVYRHIISNLDCNLIPVADEIRFLDSYLYLMKVRHGEGITTEPGNAKASFRLPCCNCWWRTPSSTTAFRPNIRFTSGSRCPAAISRSATPNRPCCPKSNRPVWDRKTS